MPILLALALALEDIWLLFSKESCLGLDGCGFLACVWIYLCLPPGDFVDVYWPWCGPRRWCIWPPGSFSMPVIFSWALNGCRSVPVANSLAPAGKVCTLSHLDSIV